MLQITLTGAIIVLKSDKIAGRSKIPVEVPILLLTSVHTLAVKYWDSLLEMSAVKSIKMVFYVQYNYSYLVNLQQ